MLFVEKHDKSLRLCLDYRRLNAITVKDVCPTPRVDVSIDKMKGAGFFATMDLRSWFYQIRVAPEWGSGVGLISVAGNDAWVDQRAQHFPASHGHDVPGHAGIYCCLYG